MNRILTTIKDFNISVTNQISKSALSLAIEKERVEVTIK